MEITIEKASVVDAAGIQKLYYETWLDTYPNDEAGITLADLTYRWRDLQSEQNIKELQGLIASLDSDNSMQFLVAKDQDKVVGSSFLEKEDSHNRFQSLYILPAYQGKGIGTKLWQEAQTFFDPTRDTLTDVVTYNKRAIAFYTKLGFIDTGKRFPETNRKEQIAIRPMMEMKLESKNKEA